MTGVQTCALPISVGTLVSGMATLAKAAFKQADYTTKAYDELAKVGSAGGITTKQILDMGINAGLKAKDLGKLTGAIKANSTAIAGLGANAADGAKIFGEMAAVGTDTVAQYSKLGVSQEDLMKSQSDYIALQIASGRSLKTEVADRKALQKASLDYQDNLLTLSQLTGEDVDSLKAKQKAATSELEWQIAQTQKENEARRLDAAGRHEEAAKLREEIKKRQEGLEATAGYGNKTVTEGLREFMATGTAMTKGGQALARLPGMREALEEYKKTVESGGDAQEAADRKSTRLNSSHIPLSRMPSSA